MAKKKKNQGAKKPSAYLIGIKGVGMTALAQHLKARGFHVSGSDTHETFFTDAVLKRHHIPFVEGFSARNVPKPVDLIVASSAYTKTNVEIQEARRCGYRVYPYAEVLGGLFNKKYGIAVCGSHGKTTTTALLGYLFKKAGLKPDVMVGTEVPQFKGNALTLGGRPPHSYISSGGRHFIAETDEYQNKFRYFNPKAVLLTNIDYDHPDYFASPAMYRNAFRNFIKRLPKNGLLVACGDDAEVRKILPAARTPITVYGLTDYFPIRANKKVEVRWTAKNLIVKNGGWYFDAHKNHTRFGSFALRIPGRHNVLNALGVIALAHTHGIPKDTIRKALAGFRGTRRRFEYIGEYHGAILIDDYAHHPAEIKATLKAARELYPKKCIIAVFHPHTYTRTKVLLAEFAASFSDANEVIVLDIYGSAREKHGGVASEDLVKLASISHKKVRHIATIPRTISYLKKHLKKGDVLLTLGAGDAWKIQGGLTV